MSSNNESCRVWSRIELKRKDGSILKLRFQDAPSSAMDGVTDLIAKYFARDETFQKAAGVSSNPEAMKEYKNVSEFASTLPIIICCHDNDNEEVGEIIGVSVAELVTAESSLEGMEFPEIKSKEVETAVNMLLDCEKLSEPITKEFKAHLAGRLMTVHPDYRGLGIANEFVKIRRLIMIDQNLPVTCSWMTAFGSQKAAAKDNWETVLEVTSDELGRKFGVVFEDSPPTFKFMLARNPNCSKR